MSPATIALIIEFSIKYGIPAAQKIIALFEKQDATIADVQAAFAAAHKSYEEYEGTLPANVPNLPGL